VRISGTGIDFDRSRHECPHSSPQLRHYLVGEPGIAPQPDVVAGAGMRKRQVIGSILTPSLYGFGKRSLLPIPQMPDQRVLPDDESQLHIDERRDEFRPPCQRAFRAWRQVAGRASSGITKPHGQERNARRIVERRRIDAHPVAQSITACVLKGNTTLVDFASGCLPGNQDRCIRMQLQDGARSERKVLRAQSASADLLE